MPLNWKALELPVFFRHYGKTAFGGVVVTSMLFLMTKVSVWPFVQRNASSVFGEMLGVASVNLFVLLCVLVLFLAYLVLSGAPLIDWIARFGLVPATDFCKEAACLGTGVWAAFLLTGQKGLGDSLTNIFGLFAIAVVLHSTKAVVRTHALPANHPNFVPPRHRTAGSLVAIGALISVLGYLASKT